MRVQPASAMDESEDAMVGLLPEQPILLREKVRGQHACIACEWVCKGLPKTACSRDRAVRCPNWSCAAARGSMHACARRHRTSWVHRRCRMQGTTDGEEGAAERDGDGSGAGADNNNVGGSCNSLVVYGAANDNKYGAARAYGPARRNSFTKSSFGGARNAFSQSEDSTYEASCAEGVMEGVLEGVGGMAMSLGFLVERAGGDGWSESRGGGGGGKPRLHACFTPAC